MAWGGASADIIKEAEAGAEEDGGWVSRKPS